jgi:hypothetical protein
MNRKFCMIIMLLLLSFSVILADDGFVLMKDIPAGKALVYLYRPTAWAAGFHYKIFANNEYVVTLNINTYYPYFVDAGKIVFSAKSTEEEKITLDTEAGHIYFMIASTVPGVWSAVPKFGFADEKEFMDDMQKYKIKLMEKK